MLKFYWNGIKDNGGKLQTCWYSAGQLINFPQGTITVYARKYDSFSDGIHAAFDVQNGSDIQTDYMEKDRIRVTPNHPLYADVFKAYQAQEEHKAKLRRKHIHERLATVY